MHVRARLRAGAYAPGRRTTAIARTNNRTPETNDTLRNILDVAVHNVARAGVQWSCILHCLPGHGCNTTARINLDKHKAGPAAEAHRAQPPSEGLQWFETVWCHCLEHHMDIMGTTNVGVVHYYLGGM